jgi:hypothetical protein
MFTATPTDYLSCSRQLNATAAPFSRVVDQRSAQKHPTLADLLAAVDSVA